MTATFVQTVNGMTVLPGPLQRFTSRREFAEFYSSSFPVFALGTDVSRTDLREVTNQANEQARAELSFEEAELAEMGYAAAVPQAWQLYERAPQDAVRWYRNEFNKAGDSYTDDPQWYPLGFLGITSPDWKQTGIVLIFYDAWPEHPDNENVTVKAFVVDPKKIGITLIDLRQGDDDYENVKKWSAMLKSTEHCRADI
jgi:hypothetical protein